MTKLSDKIYGDIKASLEEDQHIQLDKHYLNDIIKKLVDISIKIETSQADIESSSMEFQNYMHEKLR